MRPNLREMSDCYFAYSLFSKLHFFLREYFGDFVVFFYIVSRRGCSLDKDKYFFRGFFWCAFMLLGFLKSSSRRFVSLFPLHWGPALLRFLGATTIKIR